MPSEKRPDLAVILFVDGLTASSLAPYGNTMFEMDSFNQLAGQSIVFDNAFTSSPDLIPAMKAIWFGSHAVSPSVGPHVADVLAERGTESILITDEPQLAQHEISDPFDRILFIDSDVSDRLSANVNETRLASFLAQAIGVLEDCRGPCLVWIHFSGFHGPWDAPYSYRQQFCEEDDPEPPRDLQPTLHHFDPAVDSPDVLLGIQQGYLAQVRLLNELLGPFWEAVDANFESPLFCIGAPRGYSLGEHGKIGFTGQLHGAQLQVPLFVRGSHETAGTRCLSLQDPALLFNVLKKWGRQELPATLEPFLQVIPNRQSEYVIAVGNDSKAIRTHAWTLIQERDDEWMYVRPDDRWEVNNVRSHCFRQAEALEEFLDARLASIRTGESKDEVIELPESLYVTVN